MFKKLTLALVTIAFAVMANSCQDPKSSFLETKLEKDNLNTVAKQIMDENVMSREDAILFNSAVNRLGQTPDSILGKTVGQLINEEADLAKLNIYTQMYGTLSKAEILMKHKMKYLGLKPMDTLEQSYDYIVFEVDNTSDKSIADLQGQLRFFNAANQLVKAYPIELSKVMGNPEGIKPKETRRFAYPYFHQKDNQRDEIIRNSKDLRVVWFPMSIAFTDKTEINSSMEQPIEETKK
ncbi:MAG: hypothetical protein A2X64_11320 [Ignavibacteria bacterium GWF2_33_9]|nr:MAG: hypothetical protein A2X64_11320 [Ignavibacteria bacterium GWF2_33_9]